MEPLILVCLAVVAVIIVLVALVFGALPLLNRNRRAR